MSAMTGSGRRGLTRIERLFAVLADPARGERTVVAVLLGYVALWTLYGVIAKGSQDIHADMSEQFALGRELALGYPKHPPLAMAVVRAWFAVFPTADWAYYLLAMVNVGLALWIAWRLCARFLDGEKRVLGLALLTLVPFFNFHGLKFNVNTVLLPLWAATTLWFLRSFETRRVLDAALAGLGAAAAMYGKYWSIFLLLGLGIAALVDRRRAAYFSSPAPWVTIAVGALALGRLAHRQRFRAVLLRHRLAWCRLVRLHHGRRARLSRRQRRLCRGPAFDRGGRGAAEPGGRQGHGMAVLARAPAGGDRVLDGAADAGLDRAPDRVALGVALVDVGLRVVAGDAVVLAARRHRPPRRRRRPRARGCIQPIEQLWRETTDRPLRVFSGFDELTDGASFYMPSHPLAVHVLDGTASAAMEERIARDGIALLCPARSSVAAADWCAKAAVARARCSPPGKQIEVEVSRRYLGVEGKPARYLLVAIPPRQPQASPSAREPLAHCIARHLTAAE